MARKLQKKIAEWQYLPFPQNNIVLRGKLRTSGINSWSPEIEFIVDTGYYGSILLEYEIFQLLNYDKVSLPHKYWNKAETITGEIIDMPITKSVLSLNEVKVDVNVESHELIQNNLVGRNFLTDFLVLLDGNQKEISFWQNDLL